MRQNEVLDCVHTKMGIREFSVDAEKGFPFIYIKHTGAKNRLCISAAGDLRNGLVSF